MPARGLLVAVIVRRFGRILPRVGWPVMSCIGAVGGEMRTPYSAISDGRDAATGETPMRVGQAPYLYEWINDFAEIPAPDVARKGWAHPGMALSPSGTIVTFHPGAVDGAGVVGGGDAAGELGCAGGGGARDRGGERWDASVPVDLGPGRQASAGVGVRRRRTESGPDAEDGPAGGGAGGDGGAVAAGVCGGRVQADAGRGVRRVARGQRGHLDHGWVRPEPDPSVHAGRVVRADDRWIGGRDGGVQDTARDPH